MTDRQPRKRHRVPVLVALQIGLFGLGVAVVVVTPSPTRPAVRTLSNTGADSGAPDRAVAVSPLKQLQQLSAIPKRRELDEGTVADVYLDAYLMANEAMGRVEAGDTETALAELSHAQRIFERIQTELPEWRSEVVGYRTKKVSESIARLARR